MNNIRAVRQSVKACVILTAFLAAILDGCGYRVAGQSSTLPKTIHIIAVPAMENKTSSYRIEQKLTAATIHELLVKTKYHVVSDPDGGDAVLNGKVLSVEILPLLFNTPQSPAGTTTQLAQATVMLVTMKCEVTLTDRLTHKALYHTDNFVFRNEYELSSDVRTFFSEGDPAVDRLAQDFATRLVAAVTENY